MLDGNGSNLPRKTLVAFLQSSRLCGRGLHTEANWASLIISLWRSEAFILVVTPQLLEEYVAVLSRMGVSETEIIDFAAVIAEIAVQLPGIYEATKLDKVDPKDNKFLAACLESHADFLVSFDAHLLNEKWYRGTTIYTPALMLRHLLELYPPESS